MNIKNLAVSVSKEFAAACFQALVHRAGYKDGLDTSQRWLLVVRHGAQCSHMQPGPPAWDSARGWKQSGASPGRLWGPNRDKDGSGRMATQKPDRSYKGHFPWTVSEHN